MRAPRRDIVIIRRAQYANFVVVLTFRRDSAARRLIQKANFWNSSLIHPTTDNAHSHAHSLGTVRHHLPVAEYCSATLRGTGR